MRVLYLASVWLHILATIVWAGGLFFLALVVVPWLRRGERITAATFLRQSGPRLRAVAWGCFAVLLLTGAFNLWMRGVRPADFGRAEWLASPFGQAVVLKLALFAAVLSISAVHDFIIGPRATLAVERDPRSFEAERLRRAATLLGRVDAGLALALVAAAVVLVRGWPW